MIRAPRAWWSLVVLALVCAFGAPRSARAEPPKTLADLHVAEVKALLPLLRTAVKEDFRRQAFALAVRIRAADPENVEAENAIRASTPSPRQDGRDPTKPFLQKRDQVLRSLADQYAALAKATLAAKGAAADANAEVVPLLERALAYEEDPEKQQQLLMTGRRFAGAWGSAESAAFDAAFTQVSNVVSFPSELDDDALKIRIAWPESKVVRLRSWRLHTTLPLAEVGPLMLALAAQEASFVATFGSHVKSAKVEEAPTDFILVPDEAMFGKLVDLFSWDATRALTAKDAGFWYDAWRHFLFVLTPPKDNPWMGVQAQVLGQAARALVRRHLGAGASGRVSGRGTWIVDGFVGAYEGFVPAGADGGEVEPDRCHQLHAAKALFADGRWIPWAEAFELDRDAAARVPTIDFEKLRVAGVARGVKKLSPLSAQATALVLGLWRSDPVKGPKRLATLMAEIYKRDRMPDLDKTLGTGAGKGVEFATKGLDLLPGG